MLSLRVDYVLYPEQACCGVVCVSVCARSIGAPVRPCVEQLLRCLVMPGTGVVLLHGCSFAQSNTNAARGRQHLKQELLSFWCLDVPFNLLTSGMACGICMPVCHGPSDTKETRCQTQNNTGDIRHKTPIETTLRFSLSQIFNRDIVETSTHKTIGTK